MTEPRPLTEQELVDWERWCKREISWKGSDVARLIAMVRELQAELADERSNPKQRDEAPGF